MKLNYFHFIVLFLVILFRGVFINLINNISYYIFNNHDNLTIVLLNKKIDMLEKEYDKLLDFKNNINIDLDYTVTNTYMNNYGYDTLLINGNYKKGDEVVNTSGLVGIVSQSYYNYSEVKFIYDTNIPVIINGVGGKIIGKDKDNNLIIGQLTNYCDVSINDKVYSINNSYIGKVIEVKNNSIDISVLVKTIDLKNISYVGVISKQ